MRTAVNKASVIKNLVKTRIPTSYGEFTLYLYSEHGKEHLALVIGDVAGKTSVPVRVHSECLTGDVFGSRRCDCGDQLRHTLQYLGRANFGVLVYLRQEGRGIGLRKKMEAYNLQDQGMDTVEANIRLGHQPDERDYGIAARILRDLQVGSIHLITNNPHKVDELQGHGITVEARIPIEVGQHADNLDYLRSKAEKMAHLLTFRERTPEHHDLAFIETLLDQLSLARAAPDGGSFVTLTYTQSLDGGIATGPQASLAPESKQSLVLTHYLRAQHDALLVGVDTILADDPRLNVRYCEGEAPRLVILDPLAQTPPDCRALAHAKQAPIIAVTAHADPARRAELAAAGAEILLVNADAEAGPDLKEIQGTLKHRDLRLLMVEGSPSIIHTFLKQQLVNYCVITITPQLLGGLRAIDGLRDTPSLSLTDCQYRTLGSDLIAYGPVSYP